MIEIFEHKKNGYNPFLIRENWQVAILNHDKAEELASITCLDIHHLTDEAFILIEGEIVLISADIRQEGILYEVHKLQEGKVYNIPKNVWHKVAMKPGSSVLIIENANTHISDFEFYYLTESQKEDLTRVVTDEFMK